MHFLSLRWKNFTNPLDVFWGLGSIDVEREFTLARMIPWIIINWETCALYGRTVARLLFGPLSGCSYGPQVSRCFYGLFWDYFCGDDSFQFPYAFESYLAIFLASVFFKLCIRWTAISTSVAVFSPWLIRNLDGWNQLFDQLL